MYLTPSQTFITILAVALGTMVTRFMPFLLFPENKPAPKIVVYLGKVLPVAMMGFLVAYCLKEVSVVKYPYGIPEFACVLLVALLQIWRRNVLISIMAGTVVYMFLVQFVFI